MQLGNQVKGDVPKPPPLDLRCYNHHAGKKWSIKVIIISTTEVTINLKSKKNPYNEWSIREKKLNYPGCNKQRSIFDKLKL